MIDLTGLELRLQYAIEQFSIEYFRLCQQVIDEDRNWDGWTPPDRGYRDIVDTGDLRDSGIVYQLGEYEYEVTWNRPYSRFVWDGFIHSNGNLIPPRPWAIVAFYENQEYLEDFINQKFYEFKSS